MFKITMIVRGHRYIIANGLKLYDAKKRAKYSKTQTPSCIFEVANIKTGKVKGRY